MVEWVTGIVLSIIAVTLIDVIMADGETKKFIKGIASLMVLFAVLSPLPSLLNSDYSWDSIMDTSTTFTTNSSYISGVNERRIEVYEEESEAYFSSLGITGTQVKLFYTEDDSTVEITFAQIDIGSVIIPENSNINIANIIIAYMEESFGLPTHMVAIIGG